MDRRGTRRLSHAAKPATAPGGSGAGLVEHAVRHVYAIDLVGVQLALDSIAEISCTASDISDPARLVGAQLGDHLVNTEL